MVQIIEEERPQSFGQKLLSGLGRAATQGAIGIPEMMQKQKEKQKFLEQFGFELPEEGMKEFYKAFGRASGEAPFKSKKEDLQKFATGLDIINEMRRISGKKNIGRGSSILGFFPGETARDRAEFEQLGKSLIPLVAAGVPIRNQKEFEEYRKIITDPSSPLSAIEGALAGLERIFQSKLEPEKEEKRKKSKFDKKNPEHQAKAQQLFKEFGDKEKVREILRKEFEGL